jgi:uncharacterized membrane protein
MKWNPFKKNEDNKEEIPNIPGAPKMEDLNMFQRFAMKRLMKMSPAEREGAMKKAMTPKNIQKNKAEILSSLEAARKAGQISDDQYRLTKKKLGI